MVIVVRNSRPILPRGYYQPESRSISTSPAPTSLTSFRKHLPSPAPVPCSMQQCFCAVAFSAHRTYAIINNGSISRRAGFTAAAEPAMLAAEQLASASTGGLAAIGPIAISAVVRHPAARVDQDQGTLVRLDQRAQKNEQCNGGTCTALIQRGGKLSGSWDDARGRRIPGAAGGGDPLADHARTGGVVVTGCHNVSAAESKLSVETPNWHLANPWASVI